MATDFADFSFDFPEAAATRRQAYRVVARGLNIMIQGRSTPLPVHDLSVAGLAFRDEAQSLTLGQAFQFDLLIKDKVWVDGVAAKVVRTWNRDMTACIFEGLTRSQETMLDKLTLEIQKRMIDHLKKRQSEDNAGPKTT